MEDHREDQGLRHREEVAAQAASRDGFPLIKLGTLYGAPYYVDAGTELLAMALQNRVLTDVPPDNVRGPASPRASDQATASDDEPAPDWDPRLLVLLLHAFRPGLMRDLGISYPTLL